MAPPPPPPPPPPPAPPASVLTLGVSPWMRHADGAPPLPEPDAEAVPRKEDKERAARSRKETRQRLSRAEERLLVEDKELIELSRRYLIIGLFGLPVIHFVLVWYFAGELMDKNSNWYVKRNARMALLCGCVEMVVFVAWVVAYQLRADRFHALSVLTPSVSLANLA
jgi:hypothetical protein